MQSPPITTPRRASRRSQFNTALVVVWCNNADLVEFTQTNAPPYTNSDKTAWTTFIDQAVTRHTQAVTRLYNKGVRTLVMPNSVNIAATPYYNLNSTDASFLRQRAIQYNTAFSAAMTCAACSGVGVQRSTNSTSASANNSSGVR